MKTPTLNPDGVSVRGCKYIYAPKGRAGEYSRLAANPYTGCGHGCRYCYIPLIPFMKTTRAEFDAGAVPRPNYIEHLRRDAGKYQALGVTEQVMLSFTTDPYHPGDTSLTREVINVLRDHGLGFCTLTKGGTRALRDIDLFRRDRDAFGVTLTSLDSDFARLWEPKAALPEDRIAALKEFHRRGIFTIVSLEPTLSASASLEVVRATHEFVALYKVGRANYLPLTRSTDWEDYTLRMVELLKSLNAGYYIKKDLQEYLPVGMPNPLRIPQHY